MVKIPIVSEEGANMSLKAIEQVKQTEQAIAQRKAAAQAQAKAMVEQARQAGQAKVDAVRTTATAVGKASLEQAQTQANTGAQDQAKVTAQEVQALAVQARSRMASAVNFVVEKVVAQ